MDRYTHSCTICGTFLTDEELQETHSKLCGKNVKEYTCPYCGGNTYRMDTIEWLYKGKPLNNKLK